MMMLVLPILLLMLIRLAVSGEGIGDVVSCTDVTSAILFLFRLLIIHILESYFFLHCKSSVIKISVYYVQHSPLINTPSRKRPSWVTSNRKDHLERCKCISYHGARIWLVKSTVFGWRSQYLDILVICVLVNTSEQQTSAIRLPATVRVVAT